MTGSRLSVLVAVLGGIALLAGCSGNFAPTLPNPPGGGGSTGEATVPLTPGDAGLTAEDLPNDLTKANFAVTLDGVTTRVTKAERIGATTRPIFICFIIDATGSMSGEIGIVRDNVNAFADTFAGRSITWAGVEFGDATPLDGPDPGFDSGRTKVDPTTSVDDFKTWVSSLSAKGGGDGAENPLDAIMEVRKNQYSWSIPADAVRYFIVITDIYAHQRGDGTDYCDYTGAEVLAAIHGWATLSAVSPDLSSSWATPASVRGNDGSVTPANLSSDYYDVRELADGGPPALRTNTGTGGTWFDINSEWDLTSLDISALVEESYLLSFIVPPGTTSADVEIKGTWPGGSGTWDFPGFLF